MKKKFNILYSVLIAMASAFVSCTDIMDETPNAGYDKDKYFDSVEKAEMAVMGVYNSISDYRHYGWYEMALHGSDDIYFASRQTTDNQINDISHYRMSSTNEWIETLWMLKYQGIDRANVAIEGMQNMKRPSVEEDAHRLTSLLAEARFLRAMLAFDLVRYWGDVPYKTIPTGSFEEAFGERVNRDKIYDLIVEDLNFAKNNLDWATETSNPERVTQGAARALLMRVYLQRAGYSLQMDGTMTRPDNATREKYFEAVITEWQAFAENGYHDLHPVGYEELFRGFSAEVANSKESLFEIALYHSTGNRNGSAWGIYIGPQVAEPTGIPASETSKYMARANGFFFVVPEWYEFFEDTDVRRDINICTHRWIWNATEKKHIAEERKNTGWYVGKWRREWMTEEDRGKNMNYADVNFCVIRFADVLLMAAEAYNEMGNTVDAIELINKVRTRAGATAFSLSNYDRIYKARGMYDLPFIDDSDNQGQIRVALYWERGFELAFEGQRKYDLLRWGILADALKLFGENSVVNKNGRTLYPGPLNFVKGKHELLPVPLAELQSNLKLEGKNNPGY